MACTSKYSYATEQLAKTPEHPIHFKEHMSCPVINPDIFVWALDEVAVFQGDPSIWINNWTIHMFFEMYGVRWDFCQLFSCIGMRHHHKNPIYCLQL